MHSFTHSLVHSFTFTMLYTQPLLSSSKTFSSPKTCTHQIVATCFLLLTTTRVHSVSVNSHILDILCKWKYIVCEICASFLSLSIMFFGFIHGLAGMSTSFLHFYIWIIFHVCLNHTLLSQSFIGGHSEHFHHSAVVNSTAMNRDVWKQNLSPQRQEPQRFYCNPSGWNHPGTFNAGPLLRTSVQGIDWKEHLNFCVILALLAGTFLFSDWWNIVPQDSVEKELWLQNRSQWTIGLSELAQSCLKCGHSTWSHQ